MRQLADFKSGARNGEAMPAIAKDLVDEDARQASQWFANLKPKVWQTVIETDSVPRTFVNKHLMRMPLPSGGMELLGNRIVELPQDPARPESRDPHSGFVAYVPAGSIANGKELVTTGGDAGKTIACSICHGPSLGGLGAVPAVAGHSPIYLFRQLYYFKDGTRDTMSALMKAVVARWSQDDMVAITAYVGSLPPAVSEESLLPERSRTSMTQRDVLSGLRILSQASSRNSLEPSRGTRGDTRLFSADM